MYSEVFLLSFLEYRSEALSEGSIPDRRYAAFPVGTFLPYDIGYDDVGFYLYELDVTELGLARSEPSVVFFLRLGPFRAES
jgi:hypothetical protein